VAGPSAEQDSGAQRTNGPANEEHQLLLPMTLAGGGEFMTMPVTQHFESHAEIIGAFLNSKVETEKVGDLVRVRIG
jgi:RNA 3'-terminal phosphate cyclase